jgi:hypothetical protein
MLGIYKLTGGQAADVESRNETRSFAKGRVCCPHARGSIHTVGGPVLRLEGAPIHRYHEPLVKICRARPLAIRRICSKSTK